ncbi:hypothetical protein GTP45_02485 [Pseudoduganella sp. FT55W]|uniref:Uncharacterized protein n=1 Tax=Duganella rivi TaxID=2666083 RepID=A0A7X4GLH1_9BURK|nr:hypothetical protein [Duganella rivi]MYM65700.1 hypothetical protein [Duganella rivi]
MIEPYVSKVIIVDQRFLEDVGQASRTDLAEFTNPGMDTKVISLPLSSNDDMLALTRIIDASAIRPGSIVVKPGYTDHFVPVDTFAKELVHRKYGLFVQLCIALGAKKVAVTNIEEVDIEADDKSSTSATLGVNAPVASGDAEFKSAASNSSNDSSKSITRVATEAGGGAADLGLAAKLLDQYGLHGDSLFTGIYNLRAVGNNNVTKHELSLDFSNDVRRIVDSSIQAKIKVMSKLYGGQADFERVRKSIEHIKHATRLSILVEF